MEVPSTQLVGKPLTLECSVNVTKDTTSIIRFVWSTESQILSVRNESTVSFSEGDQVVISSTYTIPQLSTSDDGRVYQCEVAINDSLLFYDTNNVTLNVTGMLFYLLY